ncbi:hypothetical protein BDB00DRAFT_867599 [Zychaea mexicana]|uniref:uncharacterized protein n=1 Tax=Zychaea mexicana TaxID=64656 RepID=UPI0022FDBF45|nr:uncharacterized protein BDB00DRAFT_867599 [Zychaea mexicana]KAI9498446.1 hypothetical protein BDB00DRAFT_867599 [Zychaea mexicana]
MAFLIYYSARHAERETRLRDKASSSMKQQVQEMCPFWLDALSPGLVYYGGDRVRLSAIDSRQSTLGNRLSTSTLGNRLSTSTLGNRLSAIDSRQSTLNIDSQG